VRGVRGRLTIAIVALVALTAGVLGLGAYAFVDRELRAGLVRDAGRQATFNLVELVPRSGLAPNADAAAFEATDLPGQFRLRGDVATRVELANGDVWVDPASAAGIGVGSEARAAIDRGEIAYEWLRLDGRPLLVVGGRPPGGDPVMLFAFDATPIETALDSLRSALLAGTAVLVLLALAVARRVAARLLEPVRDAAAAAERIAGGDLETRIPVASRDEFGLWAERFNAMAASLNGTIRDLESAQDQNRRFVAEVSHELRTPLTALVAEASILREHIDALPSDARRAAELLVDDVGRLRLLVDDLMELSRFDADAERAASRPVELGDLIRSVAAARAPHARLDLPRHPVPIETDPRRVDRILGNLLDNAREHAPATPVEVGLAADDASALVWVADRGPGVPDGELDRIFERFRKLDPARGGGGSGLGLAIAAEHAGVLGGTLRAVNREGGGLRFELRLPVTGSLPPGDETVIDGSEAAGRTAPHRGIRP